MTVVNVDVTKEGYYSDGKVFTGRKMKMGQNVGRATYSSVAVPFINLIRAGKLEILTGTPTLTTNGYYDASSGGKWRITTSTDSIKPSLKSGRYILQWSGTATVFFPANIVEQDLGANRITVEVSESGDGLGAFIDISNGTLTDIYLVHEDWESLYLSGQEISPDLLADLSGNYVLRFMDWMDTNSSPVIDYEDYTPADNITFTGDDPNNETIGVPLKTIAEICNLNGSHAWVNMPAQATDACVLAMAQELHTYLDSNLNVFIEVSNEVWNTAFGFSPQTRWFEYGSAPNYFADVDPITNIVTDVDHGFVDGDKIYLFSTLEQRELYWGDGYQGFIIVIDSDTYRVARKLENALAGTPLEINNKVTRIFYKKDSEVGAPDMNKHYAERAVEVWDIFESVFGSRTVKIGAGQATNPYYTLLRCQVARFKRDMDYFAIAPYFAMRTDLYDWVNATNAERSQQMREAWSDEFVGEKFDDHVSAVGRNILFNYEGGDHSAMSGANSAQADAIVSYARSDEIYADMLWYYTQMANYGVVGHCHYMSHSSFGGAGTWGSQEFLRQVESPKFRALNEMINQGGASKS